MSAVDKLYINAGLITEDGYVKVRDGLWIKSGPYERKSWHDADKLILPSKEELHEIYLKLQELILIQKACELPSLQQILKSDSPWALSSNKYNAGSAGSAWVQDMNIGHQSFRFKHNNYWFITVRRNS